MYISPRGLGFWFRSPSTAVSSAGVSTGAKGNIVSRGVQLTESSDNGSDARGTVYIKTYKSPHVAHGTSFNTPIMFQLASSLFKQKAQKHP